MRQPTTEEFLAMIVPTPTAQDDYLEIRVLTKGHPPTQSFCRSAKGAALAVEEAKAGKGDIFYGLGLRKGKQGTSAATRLIRAIPADQDFAAYSDGEEGAKAAVNDLIKKGLKPAAIVNSGGGFHLYYLLQEPVPPRDRVRALGKRLAKALQGDVRKLDSIDDPARVLRVPGTTNHKYDPARPVTVRRWRPEQTYSLEEMERLLPVRRGGVEDGPEEKLYQRILQSSETIPVGNRHDVACSLLGLRNGQGWTEEAMLTELQEVNRTRFAEELTDAQLAALMKSRDKWPTPEPAAPQRTHSTAKPVLDGAALHGLAGDVVRAIAPQSEASEIALLLQTLVLFGNWIGRDVYFVTQGARQTANLFTALVGKTAKGRKGTSLVQVRNVYDALGKRWADRICSSISSGEGLIYKLHDDIKKWRPEKKDKNGNVTPGEWVLTEPAVEDKRLVLVLGEFSKMLRVMARETNTASQVVREAWDGGILEVPTRADPLKASGTHVSIIAHGVREEILQSMDRTEFGSGFGNRFLWCFTERSQELPHGGELDSDVLEKLCAELDLRALKALKAPTRLFFTRDAYLLWGETYRKSGDGGMYHYLTQERPGLAGSMTARAEAQVIRLALIYCLLDGSPEIDAAHLHAAKAVWDYCEASVYFIFGDALGDPLADKILRAVREAGEMTTSQIYRDLLQRNVAGTEMNRALDSLLDNGLLSCEERPTAGRPVKTYTPNALNAQNAQSLEDIDA